MGKKNVTFVLTEEIDREIEIRAVLECKQKSELVIEALQTYFTKNKREPLPNQRAFAKPQHNKAKSATSNSRS